MLRQKKWLLVLFFLSYLIPGFCHTLTGPADTTRLGNIKQLESGIIEILRETNTPAAGVALVDTAGPVWVAGLGKANVIENIEAGQNTLFRIASVSKTFVALAILKLQEQGKLNLDDKIRDHIPEVKYENPWEDTHPVRILHLLAHTTGWDEIHLVEIAHNDSIPIKLKDALDFHPHSRKSRWIPGSRYAYSNSGSAVAAYIVEKVTAKTYEEYITEQFLKPLSMTKTTFFNDAIFQKFGAVTYNWNLEPIPYRHSIYRPGSSMNSSALEMANLVHLFLTRGLIGNILIISNGSISEMETPQSNPGVKAGLQLGYGLGSVTSIHKGFVYHGHTGMIDGGLTEFAYLPDHGIGHVFFINASNGEAFNRISALIRDFETQRLEQTHTQNETAYDGDIAVKEGYYVSINPRMAGGAFYGLFNRI
ncbi:MAG: serine hydrolase domain-containing protein [Cyclobacteriaceae bacterium]